MMIRSASEAVKKTARRDALENRRLYPYIGAMVDRKESRVLLIIDVQNDFCPGGGLAVKGGDLVVPVINAVIPRFHRVAATQDWHPAGHVSFASSHAGARVFDVVDAGGINQTLWPDHCVQGTRGAELHPGLDVKGIGLILRKGMSAGMDSYSAFFENDRRTETGLQRYLKGLKVRDVYVCGLATDYCVFYTSMDARRLGFRVAVVKDACRGVDQPAGSVERALSEMIKAGVTVAESGEIE